MVDNKRFEDQDVDKANWLHEHGMCVHMNMIDLAKRLYADRQNDKSEVVKPFLHGDRE